MSKPVLTLKAFSGELLNIWRVAVEAQWRSPVLCRLPSVHVRAGLNVVNTMINLIFVFPCIIIYGFTGTSLMQIV